jgi:hypothetical protein
VGYLAEGLRALDELAELLGDLLLQRPHLVEQASVDLVLLDLAGVRARADRLVGPHQQPRRAARHILHRLVDRPRLDHLLHPVPAIVLGVDPPRLLGDPAAEGHLRVGLDVLLDAAEELGPLAPAPERRSIDANLLGDLLIWDSVLGDQPRRQLPLLGPFERCCNLLHPKAPKSMTLVQVAAP